MPPLRAAQIAYVGPASQDVRLVPTVLRRGKSVTTMACDLLSDGAVALRTEKGEVLLPFEDIEKARLVPQF